MQLPVDFFLRLIHKLMEDLEFNDICKRISKHFETEEEDFSDLLETVSLKDIIHDYINTHKDFKKQLRKKIHSLENPENQETTRKRSEDILSQVVQKKKKRTKSKDSTYDEDEETKPKKKRRTSSANTKEENEEEKKKIDKNKNEKNDDDIDLEQIQFESKPKINSNPDRVPFQRIKPQETSTNLKDNSYEFFMKSTGDNFGRFANDKLKVTKGKGFKKEKTKFKNKTGHGGMVISQTVRSIKLDEDSD